MRTKLEPKVHFDAAHDSVRSENVNILSGDKKNLFLVKRGVYVE